MVVKVQVRNEICLFFVKGDCKQGEKCWRVHFNMPYKWEVKDGQTWSALPENEAIERDFCDPSKIHSEGSERVRFDSMTRGFSEVHRLSTVSSVTQPTYILTTEWAWFWEDEYGQWVQYASIKEMHRFSSITSEDLEKRYQEDQSAVVKFTAGQQSYELSFRDMTQKNKTYGTIRMVRRRPVFVSTADTQAARSRRNGPRNPSQNFRAVPGFWDKSAIPDIGYKTVTLLSSDRDYQKVQELFNKTMRGFQITSIERVQNRDLWEVFQWKRDLMKKNNGGKNSKELHLFHGTDPKHIEAICRDNFDWRLCGTNGTVYGEGSYFARDAKYSHSYTSHSGVRQGCRLCHDLTSEHNIRVLREHHLEELDRKELCSGEYGYCPDKESCRRLHVCERYITGTCAADVDCGRSHDFYEPHPLNTLQQRGVPNELVASMLSTLPQHPRQSGIQNDASDNPRCKIDSGNPPADLQSFTHVKSIERVQNRILWEVFSWQGDVMRKTNTGKENEKQLFHGTDSKHVDAICLQNIDWRIGGTQGTLYGQGSYFSKDAKFSHSYTSQSGVRSMFVFSCAGGKLHARTLQLPLPTLKRQKSHNLL
ncbi:hypothetical protein J4Q44_G00142830 [Coregonus suidteri]|uniref:Poly [ADP-ribose] polymerase n=1 Tax=Coregonus suidteri TaxID=861788 RepID=A0AAN8LRM5_9TELE